MENHCLDGGLWVIVDNGVYDLAELESQVSHHYNCSTTVV